MNNKTYKQLNRLTIARITSGKKRLDKRVYTSEQLFSVQRLINKLYTGGDKILY